eukprot:gene2679-biopygen12097
MGRSRRAPPPAAARAPNPFPSPPGNGLEGGFLGIGPKPRNSRNCHGAPHIYPSAFFTSQSVRTTPMVARGCLYAGGMSDCKNRVNGCRSSSKRGYLKWRRSYCIVAGNHRRVEDTDAFLTVLLGEDDEQPGDDRAANREGHGAAGPYQEQDVHIAYSNQLIGSTED